MAYYYAFIVGIRVDGILQLLIIFVRNLSVVNVICMYTHVQCNPTRVFQIKRAHVRYLREKIIRTSMQQKVEYNTFRLHATRSYFDYETNIRRILHRLYLHDRI